LSNELLAIAAFVWIGAAVLALAGRGLQVAKALLALGCLAGIVAAIAGLPNGTDSTSLPTTLAGEDISFRLSPAALWLLGFGLVPAGLAGVLSTPSPHGQAGWVFGAATSLLGALGVFGVQQGSAFLIAWELMSLGGAVMILSERLASDTGRPVLFMLGLLEFGAVALLLVILLLTPSGGSVDFSRYAQTAATLSSSALLAVGILLIVGFGAKLGLLPFFEWFPNAYGAGSGASGALMSGVIMNAAFFGLERGLLEWLPAQIGDMASIIGIIVIAIGVFSAILTALYAFQEEDWRALLSFSSAENASIAVAMLGAAMMFSADGHPDLASLAWVVALLHLAGHALAKGGLFLSADIVYRATGHYLIVHTDLLRRGPWIFGAGALFAAMSLAAMPPQAGFVSEWYVFQTVFQGFHLSSLSGRLVMAIAGAGLALTVAVAFATFVKVFGIGLLGRTSRPCGDVSFASSLAVGALGLAVLALAFGMPLWLNSLRVAVATLFGTRAAHDMHDGFLLVPLTAKFAFISPTLLVIVMPILALIPLLFVILSRTYAVRRVPVWYGGLDHDPERVSTTALTFSNALRTFYSFVYRPQEETKRETNGARYFVHRLVFTHDVAPFFGPYVFRPLIRVVVVLSDRLRAFQSGQLNSYLAFIGGLLVIILAIALF
jgi:formate hydrogenlyase subunit 3/multisubunit Na+/H+ antiporter MnhD subunit